MKLIVDATSITATLSQYLPQRLVSTIVLRLVYATQQKHFPDETVVITDGTCRLDFNNCHFVPAGTRTIDTLKEIGVEPGWIVLSSDPEVLSLVDSGLVAYRPTKTWLDIEAVTLARLKRELGYDSRDAGLVVGTEPTRKDKTAWGKTRTDRWKWATEGLKGSYQSIHNNVQVKVGRTGFNNYEVVQNVREFALRLDNADELVGWDTETLTLNWLTDDPVVGESFSFDGRLGFYLPVGHVVRDGYHNNNWQEVQDLIHPILAKKKLAGANLGFDVLMCARYGLGFPRELYDVQGFAYMLGMHVPNPKALGLKALSRDVLNDEMQEYESVARGGTFDQVPIGRAAPYAADDAVKSRRLYVELNSRLDESQRLRYELIYKRLLWTCIRMSYNGMYLDLDALSPLLHTLQDRLDALEASIRSYAGGEINVNSGQQLSTLLFSTLGLPPTKPLSNGGYSTASEHLEGLQGQHPVVDLILEYKSIFKLVTTYLNNYPTYVRADGRIHCSNNPFKAITGRIASSDPNLMNIPIRTAEGREIRKLFAAQGNNRLLSVDASQLEYRVLAHFSGNEDLIRTFNDPTQDIHNTMAGIIFDCEPHEVTKQQRDIAKTAFYAILYGAAPPKIAATIGTTVSRAVWIMERIKSRIPEIDALKRTVLEQARQLGYVESLMGHRSYVWGLYSRNSAERESAARTAFDSLFQGTGSGDITAVATIKAQEFLDTIEPDFLNPKVKLVQQVHDELIIEGDEQRLREITPDIQHAFESAANMKVPIVTSWKIASNWGDAH